MQNKTKLITITAGMAIVGGCYAYQTITTYKDIIQNLDKINQACKNMNKELSNYDDPAHSKPKENAVKK